MILTGLSFGLLAMSPFMVPAMASDDCQPYTWNDNHARSLSTSSHHQDVKPDNDRHLEPGQINCRGHGTTPEKVNYYSCAEISHQFRISVDRFFFLNPDLRKDCTNIQPHTPYCMIGFIEPLRAWDGRCGLPHKNATCIGMSQGQCCNADTWTCGDSNEDCAAGTCFEGACPGDRVWSTDGTCGAEHGNRQCAGKWGDCCSVQGRCGTGPEFCSKGACQAGNCTEFARQPESHYEYPWQVGNSTDGTCGSVNRFTCSVVYGDCCNKDGKCGALPQDCGDGCQPQFGKCDPKTSSGSKTPPLFFW